MLKKILAKTADVYTWMYSELSNSIKDKGIRNNVEALTYSETEVFYFTHLDNVVKVMKQKSQNYFKPKSIGSVNAILLKRV